MMKRLLKQFIWFQSISINNQITILGIFLFIWQIKLDITTWIDWTQGIMPYPNFWDSLEFITICGFYTIALIATLLFRVFSFPVWLMYTISLGYVIWHLPMDLKETTTPHWYAFLDACYIVHSTYFFSLGLRMAEKAILSFEFGKFLSGFVEDGHKK